MMRCWKHVETLFGLQKEGLKTMAVAQVDFLRNCSLQSLRAFVTKEALCKESL